MALIWVSDRYNFFLLDERVFAIPGLCFCRLSII